MSDHDNKKGRKGSSPRKGGSSSRSRSSQGRSGSSKSSRGGPRKHGKPSRKPQAQWEGHQSKRRRDLKGAAVDLPNWVVEALARVTPKERIGPALEALGEASAAMTDGRYHAAVKQAKRAKSLAPQDATVRETLGLAAYRIGDWETSLAELRAYRRMAGDPTHLPIEIDVLRAMGRKKDVAKAWDTLRGADARPVVYKEGLVVYASFLLDEGDPEGAWDLTGPKRVGPDASEADLRVWYVAARSAAATGEAGTARRIADAIVLNDPAFPGLDELDREIAANS